MTRGQLAIITKPNEIYTSIEFNGDMYLDGWGEDAVKALKPVKNPDEYYKAVDRFNKEHHNYDEPHLTFKINGQPAEEMLDFGINYFDNWFSDYIYIKNISEDTITILQERPNKAIYLNRKAIYLNSGEIAVIHFGTCEKIVRGA